MQVVGLYNGGSPGLIYELWVFGRGAKAKRIADAGIASWYPSFTASLQLPLPSWRLPYHRPAAVRLPPRLNVRWSFKLMRQQYITGRHSPPEDMDVRVAGLPGGGIF